MYLTCIRKSMTFDATKWHTKMCNRIVAIQNLVLGMDLSAFFMSEMSEKNRQLNFYSQISVWNIIFLNEMEKHWHPIFHRIWGENAQKIIKCPFALFLRDLKKITEGGFS